MTTWPSGLRRVTRNHFSSGGVGSNPAVVVFSLLSLLYLIISFLPTYSSIKRWFYPDSNWGPWNQNPICCHYTIEPWYSYFFFFIPSDTFFFLFIKQRAQPDLNQWPRELQSYALPLSYAPFYFSSFSFPSLPALLSFFFFFIKKRLPWGSNPRPYG